MFIKGMLILGRDFERTEHFDMLLGKVYNLSGSVKRAQQNVLVGPFVDRSMVDRLV